MVEAIRATGIASRRLAIFIFSSPGPAARAPERATSNPVPRTKSRWKGKKPLIIGTYRTPPPTPPSTATIPITKVTTSKTTGQTHQAVSLAGGMDADTPASLANAHTGLKVRAQRRNA